MNIPPDVLQSQWVELKNQVQQRWSKLTDEDIAHMSGKREELIGVLHQHYGYGRIQADMEISKWLRSYGKARPKP